MLSSSILSYLFLFKLRNISSRAPDHCPPFCTQPPLPFFSPLALCPSLFPLFFVISGFRVLLLPHVLSLADDPSTLPVWIMYRDYIKMSWSNWSIFNQTLLLVRPASLWSFHVCVAVWIVCICLLNLTSEQTEIIKGHGPNQTSLCSPILLNSNTVGIIGEQFDEALRCDLKQLFWQLWSKKKRFKWKHKAKYINFCSFSLAASWNC